MKKRLLLAAGLLTLVVVAAIIGIAQLPTGPGVSKRNFDRIEIGMSKAQVEELLAGPGRPPPGAKLPVSAWTTADGSVGAIIRFDENDRVSEKEFRDHTFWGRVRSLLGR